METSPESFALLALIAHDSYRMGHFYYAAKAYDILERLDSENDYEEALKGASVGRESKFWPYSCRSVPTRHCRQGVQRSLN